VIVDLKEDATLRVDTPELTPPSVESVLTWERVQK
jgi:hypothetical protein